MKKLFIILSVLMIMNFTKEHPIRSQETESYPNLIHAFENTEAKIQKITIHIQFKSPVDADQLQTILNSENEHPIEGTEDLYLQNKNFIVNKMNESNVGSIDINIKENKEITYYQEVKKQFKKENIDFQDLIMITGIYNKEISEKQMKKITNKILKDTGAKFVEGGFIRKSFLSTSAYNPKIATHIITGANKMNLNIALKYNPSEGKTKLILATPLIYGDY